MEFTQDVFAEQMKPITGSAIRQVFHLLARPGMISFAGGNPSADALDVDTVSALAQEALAQNGKAILQYGATEGWAPLRESIAEFVKRAGIEAKPEEVLPVHGSQQALDLLLKAVINPGDVILAESPTFLGALQAMRTYSARVESIATDEQGVIPEAAEEAIRAHHPKLMYIIPTFQNPTGVTLSLERRKALAELANRYGVILAEDDPYRDLRYAGEPLPAIKSFDEGGWVVYLAQLFQADFPGHARGRGHLQPGSHAQAGDRQAIDGRAHHVFHAGHRGSSTCARTSCCRTSSASVSRISGSSTPCSTVFKYFPAGVTHTAPEGGLFVWAALPEGAERAFPVRPRGGKQRGLRARHALLSRRRARKHVPSELLEQPGSDVIETGMKRYGRTDINAIRISISCASVALSRRSPLKKTWTRRSGSRRSPFTRALTPRRTRLHIGHYIPIMAMAHMQRAGHQPIALMGGGTGMIGDPSGKSDMRKMMTMETVEPQRGLHQKADGALP